jgi:hypothetical protein
MKKAILAILGTLFIVSGLQAQSAPPPSHPKPVKHHAHKAGKHGKHHHKHHHSA